MKKLKLALLSLAFILAAFSATKVHAAQPTYKIGTESDYAPFSYIEEGKHTGFDYELLNRIAKDKGFKVEWVVGDFETITRKAANGEIDGLMSGFLISDVRSETFDFSEPYYEHGSVFAVREDEKEIKSMKDLEGKKIGVMSHTQSHYYVRDHENLNNWHTTTYKSSTLLLQALADGKVDAICNATPVISHQLFKYNGFRKIDMDTDEQIRNQVGFAVKAGTHAKLLSQFNDDLNKLSKNGQLEDLEDKFFHTDISRSTVEGELPVTGIKAHAVKIISVLAVLIIAGTALFINSKSTKKA
jgi:polar amino acid transport system substrate-binding protein